MTKSRIELRWKLALEHLISQHILVQVPEITVDIDSRVLHLLAKARIEVLCTAWIKIPTRGELIMITDVLGRGPVCGMY